MQASLYVRRGPSSGQVFSLADDRAVLIGRNASNHITLLDRDVSANHCLIVPNRTASGFVLIDARSRHGTRVNGHPFTKGGLGVGDIIQIGPFELEFSEPLSRRSVALPAWPTADRPPLFEIVPRGWRAAGIPLPPGSATVLGRGPCAHVCVDDAFASAYHCVICLDPTDDARMPFVIDLQSSNGTYIHRRPVHRKHLLPGETLVIGQAQYKLRRVNAPAEPAPEPEVEIPSERPRGRVLSTAALPPEEPLPPQPLLPQQPVEPRDTAAEAPTPHPPPPVAEPLRQEAPEPEEQLAEPAELIPVLGEPELEDILAPVDAAEPTALGQDFQFLDIEGADEHSDAHAEPAPPLEAPAEGLIREPAPPGPAELGKETVELGAPQPAAAPAAPGLAAAEEPPAPVAPQEHEGPAREPAVPSPAGLGDETVALEPPAQAEAAMPPGRHEPTSPLERLSAAPGILSLSLDETRVLDAVAPAPARVAPKPPTRLLGAAPDDYDEFFGFRESPFRLTSDPDWFFDSQHHWDCLDTLVGWLRAGPPVGVLFGEAGCGKSMLVECLAMRLSYRRPVPVVVRAPLDGVTLDGLIAAAVGHARELYDGLPEQADDPLALWRAVADDLLRRRALVAFLVDGTRALRDEHVEELAQLVQGEAASAVVRLLLAGDETVRDLAAAPPLSRRLGVSCYLAPMGLDEVAGYVAHRLFTASGTRSIPFTRRALELIAEYTGGVPRTINVVADAALLRAFREHCSQVSYAIVVRAIADDIEPGSPPPNA